MGRAPSTEASDSAAEGSCEEMSPKKVYKEAVFRWHEDNYKSGLEFGFNVQFTSFFLTSEGEEVYDIDTEHGTMPFVAIAMICDQPRIRLIPVTRTLSVQSEVYQIELADAERGQEMVGKLVKMGCTVVQRPEGNLAFNVGINTTLREMAVEVADPDRI
ncbi:MAG: hypothetical protein Q9172_004149 [Xanthocarpia lactea]